MDTIINTILGLVIIKIIVKAAKAVAKEYSTICKFTNQPMYTKAIHSE